MVEKIEDVEGVPDGLVELSGLMNPSEGIPRCDGEEEPLQES